MRTWRVTQKIDCKQAEKAPIVLAFLSAGGQNRSKPEAHQTIQGGEKKQIAASKQILYWYHTRYYSLRIHIIHIVVHTYSYHRRYTRILLVPGTR